MKKFNNIEEFFTEKTIWQECLLKLREIFLSVIDLEETLKWSAPCYTYNGKNIIGLAYFKNYVAIWFHNGVFLQDTHQKLHNAQEGITKALRQWRFFSLDEIIDNQKIIVNYTQEAIINESNGKKLKPSPKPSLEIPEELQILFEEDTVLYQKFLSFSPSCQREFLEYIIESKKPETRLRRTEKVTQLIAEKTGLHDKYKK